MSNLTQDSEHIQQPSMLDLFNLISACATKNDIAELTSRIAAHTEETTKKIAKTNERIDQVVATSALNVERIDLLENSIEILKQDQLKNNVCISGVPFDKITNNNTADIVKSIAKLLNIDLSRSSFSSYPVAANKFIIVHMYNIKNKQSLLSKIREKKSLMVEEVFNDVSSNGQIYLNDHLTPYFNRLFLAARNAKKNGQLASVTSYGGKIRVRIHINDTPTIINTESQLHELINAINGDASNIHMQNVSESNTKNSSKNTPSTSTQKTQKKEKKKTDHRANSKNAPKTQQQTHHRTRSAQRHKQQDIFDANRAMDIVTGQASNG